MIVYLVKPDDMSPCIFKNLDDALTEAKMHFESNVVEVTITSFDMTDEEFDKLEEHSGY